MAQVPTVAAPTLTPPPEMNPSIAGRPGQAIANAGAQLEQTADFGLQVANQIKKTQDEGILLDAENKITADIQTARSGLASWTDYTHADEKKQQTADELHQKYAALYQNRPDLWRYIQPYLGKQLNEYDAHVDVKAADLTASFNKAALSGSLVNIENDAATEPTFEGKMMHWTIGFAQIDAMVKNGTLWPEQGEAMKRALPARTIATEVERAENPLNSPDIMKAEMDRLKEYEGKGIVDPKDLAEMQKHLGVAYDEAVNRSKRVDVLNKVDAYVTASQKDPTLKDQTTGKIDYLRAAEKAEDDPNLSPEVKRAVREEYESRDALQKRITAEHDQKVYQSLDDRIGNPNAKDGPLTAKEVKRRMDLPPTDPNFIPSNVGDHATSQIEKFDRETRMQNAQLRMISRQEAAEKSSNIAADLLSQPGYIADRSELAAYELKGLSKADANNLWAIKGLGASKEWGDAVSLMRNSSIYPNTDEGHRKMIDDLTSLRHTVEEKHLTGPDITAAAAQMIKPKVDEQSNQTIKGLLDNVWRLGLGVFQPPVPTGTQKTPPKAGDIVDGWKFKGGDASQQTNWEQVKK